MRKLKLKMWTNLSKKIKVPLENKIIKLREERQLLGRFLVILGSRPGLVPKLSEVIGNFEMSVVPRSLVAVDGTLYIPSDKSSLMKTIEGGKSKDISVLTNSRNGTRKRILIVDAMETLKSINKTPKMIKIYDLQEEFIKRIVKMMKGYDEGRIVFDRYVDQSLKHKTRSKRSETSTEFAVHPDMCLTMSIKDLLSASSTKRKLTTMIALATLEHFMSNNNAEVVVVYDNKIVKGVCPDSEVLHTHEEADTLIPNQVLACIGANEHDGFGLDIVVSSPDTDVLIYCIDVAANGKLKENTTLQFITGKGTNRRVIDVRERVNEIGSAKTKALVGFHNFTGAD